MTRTRKLGLAIAVLLAVFLLGFVPQWLRVRALEGDLEQTRFELEMSRLEGQLGAALSESLQGDYERSRQLMADFYTELQNNVEQVEDPGRRQQLQAILEDRFDVITLLSRAEAESTQRLMTLYTRFFAAVRPPAETTPPPSRVAPPVDSPPADSAIEP